jgi:hypothetical protein
MTSMLVRNTDTPHALALSGPPLKLPVVLLHNGRCLCPYQSLDSQGVASGDLIVLCPVGREHADRLLRSSGPSPSDGIFLEVLRLTDAAYAPLEIAIAGGMAYRRVLDEERGEERAAVTEATRLAAPRISTDALPVWWETKECRGDRGIKFDGTGI